MWPNWKSWCRLCGKHESSSFVKTESITGLTENTERYLLTVVCLCFNLFVIYFQCEK